MRASLPVLLLATLAVPRAAGAEVGVLPIRGPRAVAGQVGSELRRALAAKGVQVLGPEELVRRLWRRAPEVAASLQAARRAIEEAERAGLYMQRAASLKAARRAVDSLDTVAARHLAPSLVAQARVAEALGLLLQPADEKAALEALRAAVAADPDVRPDPDRVASRAARLLEHARRALTPTRPPDRSELAWLASSAGVDRLIWIGAFPRGGRVETVLVAYDGGRGAAASSSALLSPDGLGQQVAGQAAALLGVSAPKAPASRTVAPVWVDRAPPAPARPAPWYRRWWVWAIAGAVVVGAGVTAGVVASARTERAYQLRFSY